MKVLSCPKDKTSPPKPEVTRYSGKELETTAPEGVYQRTMNPVYYYIVCKVNNATDKNTVLWFRKDDNRVLGSAALYSDSIQYTHRPDMSVILDIKNNKE